MTKPKLTNAQAVRIAEIVLREWDGILYEPWEYNDKDSLPEGFTSWRDEGAVDAYHARMVKRAAEAILTAG
jgi:hypothetical protein